MRAGLAMILAFALSGCCCALKEATLGYAKEMPKRSREVRDNCQKPPAGQSYSDMCMQAAMQMSGLQCLFDEDSKASTPENLSRACKCSRPTDAASRTAACTDWLDNG
jgi:hypothetical protein